MFVVREFRFVDVAVELQQIQHLEVLSFNQQRCSSYLNKLFNCGTEVAGGNGREGANVDEMCAQILIDRCNLIDTGTRPSHVGKRVGEEVET